VFILSPWVAHTSKKETRAGIHYESHGKTMFSQIVTRVQPFLGVSDYLMNVNGVLYRQRPISLFQKKGGATTLPLVPLLMGVESDP
jgi:hypothetical protein